MPHEEKISYLIENLRNMPEELTEEAIDLLVSAGEMEYAVVLARDKGMIARAIGILKDSGDYLWAALIAENAKASDEAKRLYREGLAYYIDNEMFGRAVSAATALKLPADEIDTLFRRGLEVESRSMNLEDARAMIDSVMESLEISLLGREDEISRELKKALERRRF